jgi:hypothetical protein
MECLTGIFATTRLVRHVELQNFTSGASTHHKTGQHYGHTGPTRTSSPYLAPTANKWVKLMAKSCPLIIDQKGSLPLTQKPTHHFNQSLQFTSTQSLSQRSILILSSSLYASVYQVPFFYYCWYWHISCYVVDIWKQQADVRALHITCWELQICIFHLHNI